MSRLFKALGQTGRRAQTTSEYLIILGLIALGSIGVILLFGNQVRELFRSGTHKVAGQATQVDTSPADQADDAADVDNIGEAFSQQ